MLKKSIIALVTVTLLCVVVAGVVRGFIFPRSTSSLAPCLNNLRQIDGAKQQWQLENRKTSSQVPTWEDIRPLLAHPLVCPEGGTYILGRLGESPKCSVGGPSHTLP